MKISENAQTLINNYVRYLSTSTEKEGDAASALKSISVVRRTDDAIYHLVGINVGILPEEVTFNFRSCNPIVVKEYDDIVGCSPEYDYIEINGSEFDEKFYTYEGWEHGMLKLTITEMNKELFKFFQPYFITSEQDWSFEISCMGAIMSVKFWGYGAYKYEKLVIRIEKLNKASITLYGDENVSPSVTVLDYEDTSKTINPVTYGMFDEADMLKLCDKVVSIMRRNLK